MAKTGPASLDHHAGEGRLVERLAFWHLALLLGFSAWALGGNASWSQRLICLFGSLGLLITLGETIRRLRIGGEAARPLWTLAPWLLLNLIIACSTEYLNLRSISIEGAKLYAPIALSPLFPSTPRPALTWQSLWLFNATFLPAFNLLVAVRSRILLRLLFILFASNAVVLAVFGTLQKLSRASGIFFGQVPSPNVTFFATFIYDNHWGAFVVLALGAALGLFFRYAAFSSARAFFNSPAFGGSLALLVLAASVPLSSSRSCTAMVLVLLAIGLMHAVRRIIVAQRFRADSSRKPIVLVFIASSLALLAIYGLARPVIAQRVAQTRVQLEHFESDHSFGSRSQLYRDTWTMFRDRPWFGWGLGSYSVVFPRYNSQVAIDHLPQYYEDAHSDWLQVAAETGVVGASLRALLVLIPLFTLLRRGPRGPLPSYSLFGCGLILLYAWLEFPFGNAAVTLAWWTSFFGAVRLTQLEAREAAR